ncbi:hypothetical protein ACWDYH_38435 [Nocardia goodfellowii]
MSLSRVIGLVVVLALGVYIGFAVVGVRQHWGADQWGDLATWIAGVATSGAVLVALWQTRLARRDAEQARIDAAAEVARVNAQFTKELEAADARLARELDASRRMEQLRTISPIWVGLTAVHNAYVLHLKDGLRNGPVQNTDEAVAAWNANHALPYLTAMAELELAFSPALMLISEAQTQRAITDLYKMTRNLPPLVSAAMRTRLLEGREPDRAPIEELLKELLRQRKPITNLVREHLTEVPPLDADDI